MPRANIPFQISDAIASLVRWRTIGICAHLEKNCRARDRRGGTLARMRKLIKEADPDIVEEWKWGVPVWSHGGIVCTGETYKSAVKLTFANGAFKSLIRTAVAANTSSGKAKRAKKSPRGRRGPP